MLLFLSCFLQDPPPSPKHPDVLLVVLDTVRRDALGAYGMSIDSSPHFDQLISKGMLFEQAWSPASWTWPSHASLFTGVYPWEHGAHFTDPAPGAIALKPDPFFASAPDPTYATLAEELGEVGYQTHSISANRLVGPGFPLVRGFDEALFLDDDSKVATAAIELLNKPREKPLFLFVNLMSAHSPWFRNPVPWVVQHAQSLNPESSPKWLESYLLPQGIGVHPYLSKEDSHMVFRHISGEEQLLDSQMALLKDLYLGEVHRADAHLNMILQAWNGEVVVVTSDHGEYFGEHGLMDHGRTLYPEVLEVPLFVQGPTVLPNSKNSNPVSTVGIFDLILRFAGVQEGKPLDVFKRPVYAAAWSDHHWAAELGGPFELSYRLKVDESIQVMNENGACVAFDIFSKKEEKCTSELELKKLFLYSNTGPSLVADEETLKQLQQLGYVGE